MRGCLLLALTTVREAARRSLVGLAALIGAAFLLLYGLALHFSRLGRHTGMANRLVAQQTAGLFLLLGLYAANLLAATVAILASCDTLSGDISTGAMQTLLSKPLARWQVLLGKWAGNAILLTAFQALLLGGVMGIVFAGTGYTAPHLASGLGLMWLEMLLMLTITVLFGTRLPTLTNGVLALGLFGLAFLGGWIEQFGALSGHWSAVRVGVIASFVLPSEALWRRAAYEMQSPLMRVMRLGPFISVSVPSGLMVVYAGVYLVAMLAWALRSFQSRDL